MSPVHPVPLPREPESLPGPDPLPWDGPAVPGPVAFIVAAWRPVGIVWGTTDRDAQRRAAALFPDEALRVSSVASAEVEADNEAILEREGRVARLRHAIGTARAIPRPAGPAAVVRLERTPA